MLSKASGQISRPLLGLWILGACTWLSSCTSSKSTPTTQPPTPTDSTPGDTAPSCDDDASYASRTLGAWQICVSLSLLTDHSDVAQTALDRLEQDLVYIEGFLPTPVRDRLQNTRIWLEQDVPAWPGAVYHPSAAWLEDNGYPPYWAGGIQIGNAENYLSWTAIQPAMVFHELAHVWHDQVLGYDHAGIRQAYAEALDAGLYGEVAYAGGGEQPAYAATNVIEYFAELSEALFWTNDFYPFTATELASYDALGHAMLVDAWQAP